MTATASNPTAIAMVQDMIKSNAMDIKLTEETMAIQISELERVTATIKEQLANGFGIDSHWAEQKSSKLETSILRRRNLYETKASLEHVLKAAGADA